MPKEQHDISQEQQLLAWRDGNPLHRRSTYDVAGECVPDFSCCVPELLSSPEEREAFYLGSEETRLRFLSTFLQRAINLHVQRKGREGMEEVVSIVTELDGEWEPS